MVAIWIFIVIMSGISMAYHVILTTQIVDFQLDRTNPIDLCTVLEKRVVPLFIPQAVAAVLSLLVLPLGLPVLAVGVTAIVWLRRVLKRNVRMFDPMTIVRDADQIKIRHMVLAILNIFVVFYGVVIVIVSLVQS